MEKWCENQTKCKEDTKETFTCLDSLAEGRAFQCPYQSNEDRKQHKYPCSGYEPIKNNKD